VAGTTSRSPTAGIGQRHPGHEDVAALAVPPDDLALLAGAVEAPDDAGLEPLVVQRHLQVVAHPPVDGDERVSAALDGDHPVERARSLGDHAAPGLDDELRLRRQVSARRADEGVEVVRDAGRLVAPRVARPEPPAEVVDGELPEPGDPGHRLDGLCERLGLHDLRPDVQVQAAHPQHR
jgi:hypothetical protein